MLLWCCGAWIGAAVIWERRESTRNYINEPTKYLKIKDFAFAKPQPKPPRNIVAASRALREGPRLLLRHRFS